MIYIVEDDQNIRELECYALTQAGFKAQGFERDIPFLEAMQKTLPRLIILDIMLPGTSGISLLEQIKSNSLTKSIPVIMVTAKDSEMNKVHGLDAGADDYIVKPFGVMELISRVKAVLRRSESKANKTFTIDCLTLDLDRHLVSINNVPISLTPIEFSLLHYLILNKGLALSRDKILENVWNMHFSADTRTVDVHMRSLRSKLKEASHLLQTVRGIGYKLEDNYAKEDC